MCTNIKTREYKSNIFYSNPLTLMLHNSSQIHSIPAEFAENFSRPSYVC